MNNYFIQNGDSEITASVEEANGLTIVEVGGREIPVHVGDNGGLLEITMDGETFQVDLKRIQQSHNYSLLVGKKSYQLSIHLRDEEVCLAMDGQQLEVKVLNELEKRLQHLAPAGAKLKSQVIKSEMPGLVKDVFVTAGAEVAKGDPLLVLEAMKMENQIKAKRAGKIANVFVQAGDHVAVHQKLVTIE
ncbi:biotin/lipoyl-containing protein [Planctomycetota bacterium]